MAYSNWTITGAGATSAKLNNQVQPYWGRLNTTIFGPYCRKITGQIDMVANSAQLSDIPNTKKITIETVTRSEYWDPLVPGEWFFGGCAARWTPGTNYGYAVGLYYDGNYLKTIVRLANGGWYSLALGVNNPQSPINVFIPIRMVITPNGSTSDDIEIFVEKDFTQAYAESMDFTIDPVNGYPRPGNGNWTPTNLEYGGHIVTDVTLTGNKLTIPSTSPCYAPAASGTKCGIVNVGTGGFYIDGVKFQVSDV